MSDTNNDFGRTRAAEMVARGEDDPDLIVCPSCEGRKGGTAFVHGRHPDGRSFDDVRYMPCSFCKGGGKVWTYNGTQYRMSKKLRDARIAKDYTTREAARVYGCTMGEWSDLEHGRRSLVDIDNAVQWMNSRH